jgi:hypothetical protein
MSIQEHGNDHSHEEDHSVCEKVGVFFIVVVAMIVFLGMLH